MILLEHDSYLWCDMKKVIILEDEEVLGRIYAKKLIAAGYDTHWAKTVEEAEILAEKQHADLVLLDHGIRGKEKSGSDLIPVIRAMLPDTKIIMLSNYSTFQLQDRALSAGADAYFVKINTPPDALIHYINELFESSK